MKKFTLLIGAVLLLGLTLTACGREKPKIYTVGVVNILPTMAWVVTGFKDGMKELGYVEGENIRYIYEEPDNDMGTLAKRARTLAAAKVDLILAITTPAALAVKEATAATNIPVVFTVVTDPVGAGIVESIQHPGGNITGVTFGAQEARRLEWLCTIAPNIKHIYMPYNAKDKSPILALEILEKAAAKLGVELIPRGVVDQESLDDAVLHFPPEADALYLPPDTLMGTRFADLVATALRRKFPTSVANVGPVREYGFLSSYGFEQLQTGKQAARLAVQILNGAGPDDLMVRTAEFSLAINLKTAKAIGLSIPDEILSQADIIIR